MTRFKRKNNLKGDKGKNILILFLCVTLFFAASSVTLSLFKKDKTTSPVPEVERPIFEKNYFQSTDFSSIENTYECFNIVDDKSGVSVIYDSDLPNEGGPLFFNFMGHLPTSGSKLIVEFKYTMDQPVFGSAGVLVEGWPYGFDHNTNLPDGTHNVKIVLDGIGSDVRGPDETYPEYLLLCYVDNNEVFRFNGSVIGWGYPLSCVQGIGFCSYQQNVEFEDGEKVITLHSVNVKVY